MAIRAPDGANKLVRVSQSPGAGCYPNFDQDVKMSKSEVEFVHAVTASGSVKFLPAV